MQLHQWKY